MHVFRFAFATSLALVASAPLAAQSYHWSTLAGLPPQYGSTDGVGAAARFVYPAGLVGDSSGAIFVVDSSADSLRRISANGTVTTMAGGIGRGAADGAGPAARFAAPTSIAIANGALFVTDTLNHAIRRVTGNGVVTTYAGRLGTAGATDGSAASARFFEPRSIASDPAGNLYIADAGNNVIRKITPDGEVTTIAGQAGSRGSTDGTGSAARFNNPSGIRASATGVLYVCDTNNHTIRRISAEGAVTTIAGLPGTPGSSGGTGTAARFAYPSGVLAYPDGTLLVADSSNHAIRRVSPEGAVSTYSGRATVAGSRDGPRLDARYYYPRSLAFSLDGVVIADMWNRSIRKIVDGTFEVVTFAGPGGNFGREDGVGPQARFNYPIGVGVHSSGDIYLADSRGNTIRRISPDGAVVTLVSGGEDVHEDGPAGTAKVNYPVGIAVAPDRTVYFCEQQRNTVRMLRPDGSVTTIAGSPGVSGVTDGPGTAARFTRPTGIALDQSGNLYVSDTISSTIRKIAADTNVVTTFAGQALSAGSADGGTEARFRFPEGVAVDADGNVYVADWGNYTIRKITSSGTVSTVAGVAGSSGAANGAGSVARFFAPSAVAVAANGDLFVADTGNGTIRRIVGTAVTTIGGSAGLSGFRDAAGANAMFNDPSGIAVDGAGNIYVSESGNNLVRLGQVMTTPVITTEPRSVAVPAGESASFTVVATGGGLLYQWRFNGAPIPGATGPTLGLGSITAAFAGEYTVVITNSLGSVTSKAALLSIATAAEAGRIINLSIMTGIATAGDSFSMGFVVGGAGTSGTKPLVIRAAGPSLGALGVPGTLDDPRFVLAKGGSNDNWGGSDTLAAAMAGVGAFAYTGPSSRDAALASVFESGGNSVTVSAAGSGTGTVLAEIYDATPSTAFTAATPRLVNVSVIKHLGTGLTAGFTIGGAADKVVLIRAIGPTIANAPFNVPGAVADPQLTLLSGQTVRDSNDNWNGSGTLAAAFARVGAFALPTSSRDAALVATLAPGSYTVQVTGVGNTTGVALVEIYEVP